jgi:hypothetical protein
MVQQAWISRRDFLTELIEQRSNLGTPIHLGLPVDDTFGTIKRLGETEYQVTRRQTGAASAEQFARLAFDRVAQHGSARLLLGYHQAKPGLRQSIEPVMQGKTDATQYPARGKYLCIILGSQQPLLPTKTFNGCATAAQSGSSNTQTNTALGAAGTDNGTATTGAHAHEKAMGTLAAHDGRLVGTFHDRVSLQEKRAITTC